eukprot:6839204-Pyramimonas_sp.AAC.1
MSGQGHPSPKDGAYSRGTEEGTVSVGEGLGFLRSKAPTVDPPGLGQGGAYTSPGPRTALARHDGGGVQVPPAQ